MKLSQCFIQTFQNILLSYGFKRKGVLFYRIHGDILQGIKLKQTNPYSIMTLPDRERKKTYSASDSWARVAFLDPRYTATLSVPYTLSTAKL